MLGDWYADGGQFAAGLWLADDEEGRHYTLWLAHNSLEKEETSQPYCVSIVSASSDWKAVEETFHAARDQWVSQALHNNRASTVAIPLHYHAHDAGDGASPQILGAVTLFGRFRPAPEKKKILDVVASIAGSWLRLNREARITRALGDLQRQFQGAQSPAQLAKLIGEILKDHASAHVKWQVLVPDGAALMPLAGWQEERRGPTSDDRINSDSPLFRFHFDHTRTTPDRAVLRFGRDGDAIHASAFWQGCTLHDLTGLNLNGEMVTALVQRVRDRMAIKQDTTAPVVATILLVTDPNDRFVGGHFSKTNLRILDHIEDYFRSSYAALLERERMGTINRTIIEFPIPDMWDDRSDLAHLRAFAQLTRDVVPCVVDAVVVELRTKPTTRQSYHRSDDESSVRPDWFAGDQLLPDNRIVASVRNPARFMLRKTIRANQRGKKSFDLVMELNSGTLSVVEETLLERILAEILATMNVHLDKEKWAVQLAEVRHNLRSVVTSLLGKAARIIDGYEAVRLAPPDVAYDRLVNRAAFHKSIKLLRYASEELWALTENIRTISGTGTSIPLQINPIDLPEMIRECLGLFSDEMVRRHLIPDFDNRLPDALRLVDGDRGWLHILMFNLIENAVKYSRQGRRIDLQLWAHGPFWQFSVANEGKYIPPEKREAIFEPYFRLDPEPGETPMPGTGIGLSSVKTIAAWHQVEGLTPPGGKSVTVDSQLTRAGSHSPRNARTIFTISIPRKFKGGNV